VRGDGAGLTPASFRFQRERGNGGGDDADRWGPACQSGRWTPPSAGEGRESTDSGFNPRVGRGLVSVLGRNVSPGPFSYFSLLCFFSFSIFLISFIDFAKMLQINSNRFQKFCKIHSKVLNQ
jgi:hypothetical protein